MGATIDGNGIDKFGGTTIEGHVIQVANYTTGAMATGTAIIPTDDTIPQITEGTQFMSLAFTAKKANSLLKIDVVSKINPSAVVTVVHALFKDSQANAIGALTNSPVLANTEAGVSFTVFIDAEDTSAHIFTVRCGGNSASTLTFNGVSGARKLGGVFVSSITITEIAQ